MTSADSRADRFARELADLKISDPAAGHPRGWLVPYPCHAGKWDSRPGLPRPADEQAGNEHMSEKSVQTGCRGI
jgi:hypothetical protein